jgi:endonuclease/exonuclease/phosphatase family metal-dependent hydrolase
MSEDIASAFLWCRLGRVNCMAIHFRLATFNIENLDWSHGHEAEFAIRMAVLKPIITELAADVICLQEIDAQKVLSHEQRRFLALDRLLSGTDYQSYHLATSVRPGTHRPADVHNLAILSRWPIIEQRQVHHGIAKKWVIPHPLNPCFWDFLGLGIAEIV